jgi:uncharacterized protein YuzB (UPF0349 family)
MNRFIAILAILVCFSREAFAQIYGNPIISWDFANGIPSNWEEGISSTTNLAHWEYRGPETTPSVNVGARGSCSAIASPLNSLTQENGFILFDGNYWDDPGAACGAGLGTGLDPAPHNAWLITESVDLSAYHSCVLTFQQQYRHFQTSTTVQISTDNGATWIEVASNEGIQSPNTEWKSVNITQWAANQSNVRFKFEYNGLYYWWLLDDITIYQPNDNDIILNKVQFTNNTIVDGLTTLNDLEYSQYPLALLPALKFKSTLTNVGGNAQTGVKLNVSLEKDNTTEVYNQTNLPIVLNPSQTAEISINSTFTPNSGIGDYQATFSILQDSTDATPLNNTDSLQFSITPFTLSKDRGAMEDRNAMDDYYDLYQVSYGNFFENKGSVHYCHTIQAGIAEGTALGKQIRGVVYNQALDSLIGYTMPYMVNYGDLNEPGEQRLVYLDFETPFTLEVDSIYFMAVEELDSIQPFFIARSGRSFGESSLTHYVSIYASLISTKSYLVRLTILPENEHPGCMDSNALNYEATATVDDGSCDFPGCTNEEADNFDLSATFDDGSCLLAGCTDSTAFNFDPLATYQGVPCIFLGCTDFNALNFNPTANENDGSCIFLYTALSASETTGCPPFQLQLTNNNEYSPEAVCLFTIDGIEVYDACSSGFDYTFDQPGTYQLNYTITIGNAIADTTILINVYNPADAPLLSFNEVSHVIECTNCGNNELFWYLNGELIEGASDAQLPAEIDGITQNGYYSLITTNNFGCTTESESIWVVQPHIATSSLGGCAPISIYFSNLTDTISGLICSLNTGISTIDDFTGQIEVEYTTAGNYNATLICSTPLAEGSIEVPITISATEIPILAVDSASMSVVCTNASAFSEFIWNLDGSIVTGGTVQPLGNDIYQLQASNEFGCGGSNLLIVNSTLDTNDQPISVFPNPASDLLQIINPTAAPMRIMNSTGQLMLDSAGRSPFQRIDISNWQSGIYHIQWIDNSGIEALRFEVIR